MLVTLNELRVHGLQWNPKTFSAHFSNMAIKYKPGKRGLQNVYNTNDLKVYIEIYLVRIEKMPHLARHKSHEKFEELLNVIRSFECKV